MKEERIAGTLTYTGTAEEIVALLREHADKRDTLADYFAAADMRRAAGEIENGTRLEFTSRASYCIDAAGSGPDQTAGEVIHTRGAP